MKRRRSGRRKKASPLATGCAIVVLAIIMLIVNALGGGRSTSTRQTAITAAPMARATVTSIPVRVQSTARPTTAPVIRAQPAAGVRCPANCTEAVALGWTAQQAAQCSHLDRDGDGVACYGD